MSHKTETESDAKRQKMSQKIKSFACHSPKGKLAEEFYEPLPLKDNDVHIKILASGCCHSDAHSVDGDWGQVNYPLVPGHEIVGEVTQIGPKVTKFKVGDRVGVGVFVGSCRKCPRCLNNDEPLCPSIVFTYGSKIGDYVTRGGYAEEIRVDDHFVFRIPEKIPSDQAAPLLCAGITTYAPFVHFNVQKGQKVAILGLGGLGHLGLQFAVAIGCEVTVISTSNSKEELAKSLGAHHFLNINNNDAYQKALESFDFILNTISADIDTEHYLKLVKDQGVFCFVGIPPKGVKVEWWYALKRRVQITGSLVGGCDITQKMLDFCAEKNIKVMVEHLPLTEEGANIGLEKLRKNEAKFRSVLIRDYKN